MTRLLILNSLLVLATIAVGAESPRDGPAAPAGTSGLTPPVLAITVAPDASADPLQPGESVRFVVRAVIDADGRPVTPRMASSERPALDAAVLAAFAEWTFEPARQNGRPVPVAVALPVRLVGAERALVAGR